MTREPASDQSGTVTSDSDETDSDGPNGGEPEGSGKPGGSGKPDGAESDGGRAGWLSKRRRISIAVVLVLVVLIVFQQFGDVLTPENFIRHESALQALRQQRPVLVFATAFLIYVLVTGMSLPGAALLSLICAWYFGFRQALLLVSFASTCGATVAFLVSRYLLRDIVRERLSGRLAEFNRSLETEGPFFLFVLRLIPAVPFFVINLVMGLTPMRVVTFWWVSQLGMLPGTAVYVYAGSQFPDLQTLAEKGAGSVLTPQLIAAFALLGFLPLVLRTVSRRIRGRRGSDDV